MFSKQELRDFVKYNPLLFSLYKGGGSAALRVLGKVLPVDERKVFFISFGGRRYDDSPKAIYEEMLKRPEFDGFTFVWAFVGNPPDVPGNPRLVKTDTPEYYREVVSSKFWVTNASVERGLSFKRKGQVCINTWHGTPLKRIGSDNNTEYTTRIPGEHERFDLACAQGEYDRVILSRIFRMSMDKVLTCGLPRNDALMHYTSETIAHIRERLDIPEQKRVLLYTPTFREYERNTTNTPIIKPPIDLEFWENELGEKWVLLVRAHYLMTEGMDLGSSEFVKDVSGYEPLNDLYAVADAMISDYSSTYFDYAALERPMFCFGFDYDEYADRRGLYDGVMDDLPCSIDRDEHTLLKHIKEMNYAEKCEQTARFRAKYAPCRGDAGKVVVDEMLLRFS